MTSTTNTQHRIYRLAEELHIAGQTRRIAITSFPMGPALVQDYPTVIDAVRFYNNDEKTPVANQQNQFYEKGVLFTETSIFQVFDFPLSKGDPRTALQEPYSIVLTEEMARKIFRRPGSQWDRHFRWAKRSVKLLAF